MHKNGQKKLKSCLSNSFKCAKAIAPMDLGDSLMRGFRLSGEGITEGFAFAKTNWKNVFFYYLVSLAVIALAAVAGAVIGGGVAYFTYQSIGWIAACAIGVVLFFILFIAGLSYGYASVFGAIEYIYNNKKAGYFESSNVGTAFKWAVLGIAVIAAIGLVFGGAFLSMATIPLLGILLFMLFYIVFIVAIIVVAIIAYYAIYEGATKKKGPIDAICSSYRLLRANLWETIVFVILMWAIGYITGLVAGVVFYALYFLALIAMIVNPIAAFALIAVAFVVFIILQLAISCFLMPMQVLFYRKIVEGKGMETPKKKGGPKPAGGVGAEKKPAAIAAKRK